MAAGRWTVRLTASAEADMTNILSWTTNQFGETQARVYAQTLSAALVELATDGPATIGAKARDDIAKGLFSLHVARHGRKGRHLVLFRVSGGDARNKLLDVLRILHDAMDLLRHIPPTD